MKNHVHKAAPPGMKHHRNYGKYLYTAFLVFTLIACNVQPVMAATIWDKASEIMKDVYNQIILISTIAAAERYILLGVLVYTAPVAFSTGASQATGNIFKSWCRMLGGQFFLLLMNAWCLRLFTSMVGTFLANPLSL